MLFMRSNISPQLSGLVSKLIVVCVMYSLYMSVMACASAEVTFLIMIVCEC